jgi:glucosamine-6-phosphate deaminase
LNAHALAHAVVTATTFGPDVDPSDNLSSNLVDYSTGKTDMQIKIFDDAEQLGAAAAKAGAKLIRKALSDRDTANIILATGASQFALLANLVQEKDLDWSKVRCFHLDEYVGMSSDHPASFRRYLKERFVDALPIAPYSFEYIDGEADPHQECARLGIAIESNPIDVAFIGIGENGHLAFNDPPADFETTQPYLVVELDEACRRQQLGEGWFESFEAVPTHAISMSVNHILKSKSIVCSVPDERKSTAVKQAVEGEVTPQCPASILNRHASTTLYLDAASASQLTNQP